jgi:hypothetical protein
MAERKPGRRSKLASTIPAPSKHDSLMNVYVNPLNWKRGSVNIQSEPQSCRRACECSPHESDAAFR